MTLSSVAPFVACCGLFLDWQTLVLMSGGWFRLSLYNSSLGYCVEGNGSRHSWMASAALLFRVRTMLVRQPWKLGFVQDHSLNKESWDGPSKAISISAFSVKSSLFSIVLQFKLVTDIQTFITSRLNYCAAFPLEFCLKLIWKLNWLQNAAPHSFREYSLKNRWYLPSWLLLHQQIQSRQLSQGS